MINKHGSIPDELCPVVGTTLDLLQEILLRNKLAPSVIPVKKQALQTLWRRIVTFFKRLFTW
jgi:hypothetical protein